MVEALLVLETGKVFKGEPFGHTKDSYGEVVFNTSFTGYQEILTDPSYKGQIVVMTSPHIGNYGIGDENMESCRPFVEGFVVREYSELPSHWKCKGSINDFLKKFKIIGISGVDTRAVTKYIREKGAMRGAIVNGVKNTRKAVANVKKSPGLVGRNLVKEVTCTGKYSCKGVKDMNMSVVVMDFGVKKNIINNLTKRGCNVCVVPAEISCKDILSLKPDGIVLSNGPGDPKGAVPSIRVIQDLLLSMEGSDSPIPIFGICLGHQLLCLALGGDTYKLKFGHRGANHPVKDVTTGKVEITCQNHGFAVNIKSLEGKDIKLTHINLNDQTLEGMAHNKLPVFSVQYHPEASPGPHDSRYLFDRFVSMMKKRVKS